MAREATPGHRAQERARRHRPGQAEVQAGVESLDARKSGSRKITESCVTRNVPTRTRMREPGVAGVRWHARLERLAAKRRPGGLRRRSGRAHTGCRRATVRAAVGSRLRPGHGKILRGTVGTEDALTADSRHQPGQAKDERGKRQPESLKPQPWQNPHVAAI